MCAKWRGELFIYFFVFCISAICAGSRRTVTISSTWTLTLLWRMKTHSKFSLNKTCKYIYGKINHDHLSTHAIFLMVIYLVGSCGWGRLCYSNTTSNALQADRSTNVDANWPTLEQLLGSPERRWLLCQSWGLRGPGPRTQGVRCFTVDEVHFSVDKLGMCCKWIKALIFAGEFGTFHT